MFKERLIKYKQLDKESEELYYEGEKVKSLIERMIEESKKKHLQPIIDRKSEIKREKDKIEESIEKELRDGLAVLKQEFSQDLKPAAEKALIMLEEYAEIDGYYKRYISAQEITPLVEYFLKIEDADSCMRALKGWHKMEVAYSYDELAERYATTIGDSFQSDRLLEVDQSEFEEWKRIIFRRTGDPQEFEMYKMIKLLGRLDARHDQITDKIYYSEKTKKAIMYASIGGFGGITKEDGYCYVIEPQKWLSRSMPWVEKYRQKLMKVHYDAYLEEKQIIKEREQERSL